MPSPDPRLPESDDARRLRELTEQMFGFLDQLAECRSWNEHLRQQLDAARAELEVMRSSQAGAPDGKPEDR